MQKEIPADIMQATRAHSHMQNIFVDDKFNQHSLDNSAYVDVKPWRRCLRGQLLCTRWLTNFQKKVSDVGQRLIGTGCSKMTACVRFINC